MDCGNAGSLACLPSGDSTRASACRRATGESLVQGVDTVLLGHALVRTIQITDVTQLQRLSVARVGFSDDESIATVHEHGCGGWRYQVLVLRRRGC